MIYENEYPRIYGVREYIAYSTYVDTGKNHNGNVYEQLGWAGMHVASYLRLVQIYIFMCGHGGTEIGKGGPVLAAKIGPAGSILAADRFFLYRPFYNACAK